MAGQGLLPLKLASETLTWLQSIFRCPRAAVLSIRHSPCLLALGVVAVHEAPAASHQCWDWPGWLGRSKGLGVPQGTQRSRDPQTRFLNFRAPDAKPPGCLPGQSWHSISWETGGIGISHPHFTAKQTGWDLKCLIKGRATAWTQGFQGQNWVPFPYLTLGKTLGDSAGNPTLQRTWSQTSDN